MTLNDSIDDEVEFDSMGNEVPKFSSAHKSGTSNGSVEQNILTKLIKEKSIAILSME